ncbi:RidA family protein [uncultured Enterococcus sp.]|uniref:RidA family protein n=1 Tax=uncultured Enterococcus sp. TaxID=167972 RepID=UPI002AA7EEAA|nr:RidA family protein [uncultured Enterococcus sp.]
MIEKRNPETVHPPLGVYVHQIEQSGNLRWLTLSGQVGMSKEKELSGSAEEQFQEALANIRRNLEAGNMSVQNLTKLVIYLVEPIAPERRSQLLSSFLEGTEVCMTLLYVKALAAPNILVEIDAWAVSEQ